MRTMLAAAAAFLALAGGGPAAAQAQFSFDWPAIAARLVTQLAPRAGEKILAGRFRITAEPDRFQPIAVVLQARAE